MPLSSRLLPYNNKTQLLDSIRSPLSRTFMLSVSGSVALMLSACSGGAADQAGAKPAMPPAPVSVLEMQPTNVPAMLEIPGQTEGSKEVEVRARVGGLLQKKVYQEGEPVKAGQPLFQIESATYQNAVMLAKGQALEAKAKAEQAAREARRTQTLIADKAVSQKEYDDAQSNASATQAAWQAAEARLKDAELNLSYATVTAPVAGIAGRAVRSEGWLMNPAGDSLLTTVVQTDPLWVRFGVGDGELSQIPGGKLSPKTIKGVQIVQPDGKVYSQNGKINFAASQLDPKLGTLQLRAEFANPENQLLPGQYARVRLITGTRTNVFLVPQTAVLQSEQGRFVFVVGENNQAQPRPVKAGEWYGKDWVILDGLKAGDKVIVDNLIKMRPGVPVNPQVPGAAPKTNAAAPTPEAKSAEAGKPAAAR